MGTQLPLPKKGHSPNFRPIFYCGKTAGCINMPLGMEPMEVGLSPGDFVRWGPSPLPKKGRSPQFLADVYCGQTAAWIKMPLGKEVNHHMTGLSVCWQVVQDRDDVNADH